MDPNESEYARVKMKVGSEEEDQKKHQEGVASEAREKTK